MIITSADIVKRPTVSNHACSEEGLDVTKSKHRSAYHIPFKLNEIASSQQTYSSVSGWRCVFFAVGDSRLESAISYKLLTVPCDLTQQVRSILEFESIIIGSQASKYQTLGSALLFQKKSGEQ